MFCRDLLDFASQAAREYVIFDTSLALPAAEVTVRLSYAAAGEVTRGVLVKEVVCKPTPKRVVGLDSHAGVVLSERTCQPRHRRAEGVRPFHGGATVPLRRLKRRP